MIFLRQLELDNEIFYIANREEELQGFSEARVLQTWLFQDFHEIDIQIDKNKNS